jgi:hypothetical protein
MYLHARAMLIAVLLFLAAVQLNAGEVYKWKDADGRVHYGEREGAPVSGEKIEIRDPATQRKVEANDSVKPLGSNPRMGGIRPNNKIPNMNIPPSIAERPGEPVDLATVNPRCNEQAKKLAAMGPSMGSGGESRKPLIDEIKTLCPNVAYNCKVIISRPQENVCVAIKRSASEPVYRLDWQKDRN